MVKALVLYFLSVKPTYGYDIQRFIEIDGMDQWAKVKSGSIYYALNKLEKDGFIFTLREERTGARIRKIYAISDKGVEELRRVLKEELLKPIDNVEADKFMIYLMFNRLERDEIIDLTRQHIQSLEQRKKWWEDGRKIKVSEATLKVEILHFDNVIANLDNQIKWHKTLIEEIDEIIKFSKGVEQLIRKIDFGALEDVQYKSKCEDGDVVKQISNVADDIMKNPTDVEEKIETLIKLLRKH
ncbi:DNA-binding PadR family transcriptional regulator [Clostridium acetobutylicum]|uniref:Fusion: transcriptional regulator and conserved domain n=1 Tax=Clostridium acetobutylicum (strain ATCC 824 / DSM 792 / JCM 1419 / IAM 19013 / LMG 5710 / NBRC 13948 / NRRL B-527 / VKM B-1787 / 2291 / W) TaxID=272562 RepID=Q97KT4_CLOAB|nr:MULTISPECIES: PadR family transcriptional regulator [Clostridium]AAK78808.1 Fusion: transcriptional regulator and conserved domain [Clostridium acetobutylicum ATCC 824]ADZ19882.1 Fusion: transcriptional regulator and conserved domain protein [Clostridium acetobutylicum EA 2018]AEI31464.1 bifunctional transcriptional regulator/hypothetical protein [Clostridium acetobutylicum DSM 1731]AWV80526.1 PadR family transcriptional regulator [Clostridium acetobutylicum]MBC2392716.1 PadR family transcr